MRTESDLRAALASIADQAPRVEDVLPVRRPSRARWSAPVIAAALVIAVAVTLAVRSSNTTGGSAAHGASGDLADLVGIDWRLDTVDGHKIADGFSLRIEPNGRFDQLVAYCTTVYGTAELTTIDIVVTSAAVDYGMCPYTRSGVPSVLSPARRLFTGPVQWRVVDGRLSLTKGDTRFIYTRPAGAAARTRQWTNRGVGITTPAQWTSSHADRQPLWQGSDESVMSPDQSIIIEFSTYLRGHPTVARVGGLPAIAVIDGVEAIERITPPPGKDYQGPQMLELDFPVQGVTVTIVGTSRGAVMNEQRNVFVVRR